MLAKVVSAPHNFGRDVVEGQQGELSVQWCVFLLPTRLTLILLVLAPRPCDGSPNSNLLEAQPGPEWILVHPLTVNYQVLGESTKH